MELSKIPSTIPEGSKESTDTTLSVDTPDLEKTLKNKTSGYLEKMSKVIMSTKSLTTTTTVDGGTLTAVTPSVAVTPAIQERHRQEKQQRKRMSDQDVQAQKLPRVFYPLD